MPELSLRPLTAPGLIWVIQGGWEDLRPQGKKLQVEAEPWAVAPHIETNPCLCLGSQITLNGKPRQST